MLRVLRLFYSVANLGPKILIDLYLQIFTECNTFPLLPHILSVFFLFIP
jgi:hypothetical protein